MINSMTAFAKKQSHNESAIISWEIKTVNNRYLDMGFRLPEAFRDLELKFRALIKKHLSRGKVDCSLRYQPGEKTNEEFQINDAMLRQLNLSLAHIQEEMPVRREVDAMSVLKWPGVLSVKEGDLEEVKKIALESFEEALGELKQTRQREGEQLKTLITTRLQSMSTIVKEVKQFMPEIVTLEKQRVQDRFDELSVEVDQDRLAQEMVYFAQKTDVMEELDRLETHLVEVARVVDKGGVVGRRLDFLTQELNREANTLGSKSVSEKTTKASVELKVLIEQIREQVQNIE